MQLSRVFSSVSKFRSVRPLFIAIFFAAIIAIATMAASGGFGPTTEAAPLGTLQRDAAIAKVKHEGLYDPLADAMRAMPYGQRLAAAAGINSPNALAAAFAPYAANATYFPNRTAVRATGNPQPAIIGTSSASNHAIIFSDPGNAPTNQIIVPGLPADAQIHGVASFGADMAFAADFNRSRIFLVQVSTGALLATINTSAAGYDGTGTIAVAPNRTSALAMGNDST
ncbi:MAG: hypothetical protein WBO10_06895, partial [Pyrinomonadaceae bacterium]